MSFHAACRIVSCSVVMLTRFPTICDYRQTRSPLEKGAAKGRDRRKRQLSNFFVAGMGDCWKYGILQMAVIRDNDYLISTFMPLRRVVPLRGTLSYAFGAPLLQGATRVGLSHIRFHTATAGCASPRHSILRLWRAPSSRGYSRRTGSLFFHTAVGLLFPFSFSKVFVGAPETLFEGDLGLPVKVAFGFGVVQGGAVDVAFSGFIVGRDDLFAGYFGEDGYQFFQAGFLGRAEIVGSIGRFGRERIEDAVCDITGVDEVAGLISIAENGDAFPFGDTFRKNADDAAFTAIPLAFAVDIGKAEDDIVYAIGEAVELEIIFCGLLGEAVEGEGLLRQGLGNRESAISHIPIGRRRGGEDNALDAVFPAALEDADGAGDVLMHIVLGIGHGVGDEGLCSEVNDGVEVFLLENVFDGFVMNIHDDEFHMREQVLTKAG